MTRLKTTREERERIREVRRAFSFDVGLLDSLLAAAEQAVEEARAAIVAEHGSELLADGCEFCVWLSRHAPKAQEKKEG